MGGSFQSYKSLQQYVVLYLTVNHKKLVQARMYRLQFPGCDSFALEKDQMDMDTHNTYEECSVHTKSKVVKI